MASILIMPRQGNTVESCIIVDWKVKEGDEVTSETTACEVETDKASFEVPAGAAGKILKLLWNAGDDVPVLSPIAVIGKAGEDWQAAISKEGAVKSEAGDCSPNNDASPALSSADSGGKPHQQSQASGSQPAISPRARSLAEKEALPFQTVSGTGPEGRIIERDVLEALEKRPALTAAAKAAGAEEVPPLGSGIGGRVTAEDLSRSSVQVAPASAHQAPPRGEGTITETPIKGIRKVICDKMLKSLAESAQFTLNASASVSKLQEIRSRIKDARDFSEEFGLSKITVNDLILFAASRVLPRYNYMNAHKTGEIIKTFERVHLGMAVDTPRGLMVPVIRNADLLSLAQISSEAKRLAAACQNGAAKPDEISGSTFTVSNLGSLGITSFTPVLNAPEVAILGVCGIEMKPVPEDAQGGGCRFEPHIGFSLTINHQIVDGAPAARFLKALCGAVSNIDLLLAAS